MRAIGTSTRSSALLLTIAVAPLLTLTACAPSPPRSESPADTTSSNSGPVASQESAPETTSAEGALEGSTLRFASAGTTVDVVIGEENQTIRDLASRLPLELTAEEFAGREKIADVPGGLDIEGSPGSDPEDGDLIYYTPWGNLGFYYDASGIGYSDQTIHIGTYEASRQQLDQLEGPITITLVR